MNKRISIILIVATSLAGIILATAGQGIGADDTDSRRLQKQPDFLAIAPGLIDVRGGLVRVYSRCDGLVKEVYVKEGDTVRKGQPLLTIDTTDAKIEVAIAKAALEKARSAKKALDSKLAFSKDRLKTLRKAADVGATTGAATDDAQVTVQQLQASVADREADIEIAKQRLIKAQRALTRCKTPSPVSGKIVTLNTRPGQDLTSTERKSLFEILPKSPLIVRAEVNEAFIDKIKPGLDAEIIRDDNTVLFKSHVISVGDIFHTSQLQDGMEEQGYTRSVQCILTGPKTGYRVGQSVRVRFIPARNPT